MSSQTMAVFANVLLFVGTFVSGAAGASSPYSESNPSRHELSFRVLICSSYSQRGIHRDCGSSGAWIRHLSR